MAGCLDSDALLAWVAGTLSEAERARALEHIDGCTACRQALSALARIEPTVQHTAAVPVRRQRTWLVVALAAAAGVAGTIAIASVLGGDEPEPTAVAAPVDALPGSVVDAAVPERVARIVEPAPVTGPGPIAPSPTLRSRPVTPADHSPAPDASPTVRFPDEPPGALAQRPLHRLRSIAQALDAAGDWKLPPGVRVLIAATPGDAVGDRRDMGGWWLEAFDDAPGFALLATHRRVWIVGELARVLDGKLVLRAIEVHAPE